MNREDFHRLPITEIINLVKSSGQLVGVFFSNGTRRWFLSEYPETRDNYFSKYIEASVDELVRIIEIFYSYGLETLVVPVLSDALKLRGASYLSQVSQAIPQFFTHKKLLDLFQRLNLRVRFFGDLDSFSSHRAVMEDIVQVTKTNGPRRLFFGIGIGNTVNTLATLSVKYFQVHGVVADQRVLSEMYFGEFVPPANLLVNSGMFYAAELPLLVDANTQLYYSVSPSFFMTEFQMREILYDYLFARQPIEVDYARLSPKDWQQMRAYFAQNKEIVLGIGEREVNWGLWYPVVPQISMPGGS